MRTTQALLLSSALLAAQASSAAQVVESQGTDVRGSAPAASGAQPSAIGGGVQTYPAAQSFPTSTTVAEAEPAIAAASAPAAVASSPQSEIFLQLQTLQSEVQELRGLVEEQRHLIERLTEQQKEQYLDLDKRIVALRGGSAAAPSTDAGGGVSFGGAGATPSASVPATGGANVSGGEREAYTAAFNLTRDKRFEDAIAAFNQLLVDYPKGEYSGNAYYWLGELYLALPAADLEKSRQSFSQVVGQYPDHPKVADSLYKLGVVYHRLGDNKRALEYLDQAQQRFPSTPAARLAQSYAAQVR
jgi:tol-pal system protein YbgF